MPDESDLLSLDNALAIAGVLCVSPTPTALRGGETAHEKLVRLGPAAGWMLPRGILAWERELSVVSRADAVGLAAALRATLPHEQIAPKRYPMAARAAASSPLVAISASLAAEARASGIRVHTVGVDRVSSGFFYFADGGGTEPVRVQGNLVEMLAPSIGSFTTNAEIETLLDGMVDRLVSAFSGGAVSELAIELADALPRLSRDATGLSGTDLDAFETRAAALAALSAPFEAAGRQLAELLGVAGDGIVKPVPLFGQARRDGSSLEVMVAGAPMRLPSRALWVVVGSPRIPEVATPPATALAPVASVPVAIPSAAVTADGVLPAAVVGPAPVPAPVAAAPADLAPIGGGAVVSSPIVGVGALSSEAANQGPARALAESPATPRDTSSAAMADGERTAAAASVAVAAIAEGERTATTASAAAIAEGEKSIAAASTAAIAEAEKPTAAESTAASAEAEKPAAAESTAATATVGEKPAGTASAAVGEGAQSAAPAVAATERETSTRTVPSRDAPLAASSESSKATTSDGERSRRSAPIAKAPPKAMWTPNSTLPAVVIALAALAFFLIKALHWIQGLHGNHP